MGFKAFNYQLANGLISDEVYMKINNISGNTKNLTIDLKIYISKEASDNGLPFIDAKIFNFVPSLEDGSENFIKQGYNYLKTLPEFGEVVDVV